jgi:hypothetical protein
MTEIELKLKDYLSKDSSIIEKSLKNSFFNFDCIIVTEVEIGQFLSGTEEYFQVHCITMKGMSSPTISPWIEIPIKFLRKNKLQKLRLYQK